MRTITDLNGELLRTRYIAAPERVQFTGADGWAIEGWLLKPRGFDPSSGRGARAREGMRGTSPPARHFNRTSLRLARNAPAVSR